MRSDVMKWAGGAGLGTGKGGPPEGAPTCVMKPAHKMTEAALWNSIRPFLNACDNGCETIAAESLRPSSSPALVYRFLAGRSNPGPREDAHAASIPPRFGVKLFWPPS